MLYNTSFRAATPVARPHSQPFTCGSLARQNLHYSGSRGVSVGNRTFGFKPAFLDRVTGEVYLARYADGRLAPIHVLDGLPQDLVIERMASGRVAKVSGSVIAGFVKDGRFFTREEAAATP